jgi:flavin reductase (DIM6/NTAB) family NADH-FMN oxidoreductase RutF
LLLWQAGRAETTEELDHVAWAGTICSDPPMLSIAIRKERGSHQQIKETREFTVNLVDKSLLGAISVVKSDRILII